MLTGLSQVVVARLPGSDGTNAKAVSASTVMSTILKVLKRIVLYYLKTPGCNNEAV